MCVLPEPRDGVGIEGHVATNNGQPFDHGLSDQQAVERGTMVVR
jgi:hypothetical protein